MHAEFVKRTELRPSSFHGECKNYIAQEIPVGERCNRNKLFTTLAIRIFALQIQLSKNFSFAGTKRFPKFTSAFDLKYVTQGWDRWQFFIKFQVAFKRKLNVKRPKL